MEPVKLWPINSLPVPFPAVFEGKGEEIHVEPVIDIDDNFPKGRIHKYYPNQGYGFVKDRTGREVYFKLAEMEFLGGKDKDSLKEGVAVGYDLSHSGRGLHVKKMKIY